MDHNKNIEKCQNFQGIFSPLSSDFQNLQQINDSKASDFITLRGAENVDYKDSTIYTLDNQVVYLQE